MHRKEADFRTCVYLDEQLHDVEEINSELVSQVQLSTSAYNWMTVLMEVIEVNHLYVYGV